MTINEIFLAGSGLFLTILAYLLTRHYYTIQKPWEKETELKIMNNVLRRENERLKQKSAGVEAPKESKDQLLILDNRRKVLDLNSKINKLQAKNYRLETLVNSLSKPKITNITIDHIESIGFTIDSVKYEIIKFDVKDVVNYKLNIQDNTMSVTCKTKIEPNGKEN